LALRTFLGLIPLPSRKLHRKAETSPGLGAREVLVARDVLVLARDAGPGCWAVVLAAIIATVLTTAELAGARLLNHRESKVLVIIEVVQDRGVSLGEGFSLRELKSSKEDGLENISDIDVAVEEFQRLQSVADIAEVRSTSALEWPSQAMRRLNSRASRTVCMRLWLIGNAVRRALRFFLSAVFG